LRYFGWVETRPVFRIGGISIAAASDDQEANEDDQPQLICSVGLLAAGLHPFRSSLPAAKLVLFGINSAGLGRVVLFKHGGEG
jgi:hypothetical protein